MTRWSGRLRHGGTEDTALDIKIPALTPAARRHVLTGTIAITLASIAVSEVATLLISLAFDLGASLPAYLIAGVIPLSTASIGSYLQLTRLEQARTAYRELERVSASDWLTGCLNFRAFTLKASAATRTGSPGALLLVDIDSFKQINDRFGHEHGDNALGRVAGIVTAQTGSSDLIGRIGGDKFGVYLRVATERQAREIAEAIRAGIAEIAFAPDDAPCPLTASIGIATTGAAIEFSLLLRIAERQLSVAKDNGRNRFAITAAEAVNSERAAA